jgi:hypothetical protein
MNIARTLARDVRRNPDLAGEDTRFLQLHGDTPDFLDETDYGYTVWQMLWDHHKYLCRGGTDEKDETNMLDRLAYHRKFGRENQCTRLTEVCKICGHTEEEVGPLSANAEYDAICDDCLAD